MIEPDDTIRFKKEDVPEIPELPKEPEQEEKSLLQRKLESIKWLEEHCQWQPFGDVW